MHAGEPDNSRSSAALAGVMPLAVAVAALAAVIAAAPGLARYAAVVLIVLAVVMIALLRKGRRATEALIAREREAALSRAWSGVADGGAMPVRTADELARLLKAKGDAMTQRLGALESLVAAVDTAAIGVDGKGRVWLANEAASELFGPGLVDRDIEEIFTQPEIVAIASAARRGTARHSRIRVSRSRGPIILDVSAQPLAEATGAGAEAESSRELGPRRVGAVLTFRDVTELATAVQLKTDFVANASHELRTPLAAIRASVETIQDAAGDDPEARSRFLKTIASATTRLEDLCRDLMDLSRVETAESSVELGEVSAGALAADLTEHFESACAERSLTLRFEIDRRAATVRSDARLLSLILRNLIENSTKFAFERTTIRVVFAPGQGDPRDLVIEVVDQGIGIPIGLQARIFERFFQADPARAGNGKRGTGLGLAIVKHAVRALGGTISVNSVWKQGTTMRVELPDALAEEAASTST